MSTQAVTAAGAGAAGDGGGGRRGTGNGDAGVGARGAAAGETGAAARLARARRVRRRGDARGAVRVSDALRAYLDAWLLTLTLGDPQPSDDGLTVAELGDAAFVIVAMSQAYRAGQRSAERIGADGGAR